MQGKQADPARDMNRILMWVVPVNRDFVGNVVNNNHRIEDEQNNKDNQEESKVVLYGSKFP